MSKTIGVCLSGGGHRASLFSLGALLYLVDAGRNREVQVISSVSGGSLTNAFLATQASSFSSSELDAATFDKCAARFARSVAGSPRWWAIGMTVHVALFLWWLSQLPSLLAFGAGWWHAQALYAVAALLFARTISYRSGGSLWAYWGTWAYASLLFPALVLLVAIWSSVLSWKVCLLVTAAVFVVFRCWNLVADRAFRHMIATLGEGDRQRLEDIHATPRHVFCATDMETGKHVFFSKDLLYAPQLGVGLPDKLWLSTAVQVSANFPVGFPHRWLKADRHDFRLLPLDRRDTWRLVLSDGGVSDNLGLTWFADASHRTFELRQRLGDLDESGHTLRPANSSRDVHQRVIEQITAMEQQPELLICVNSSAPYTTRKVWFSRIPIFAALASLVDVQAVMYNCHAIEISRTLRKRFFAEPSTGTMVSIEEDPDTLTIAAEEPDKFTAFWNKFDISTDLLEHYRDAAQRVLERARIGPTHESEAAEIRRQIHELQEHIDTLQAEAGREPETSTRRDIIDQEIPTLQREQWKIKSGYESELERRRLQRVDNTMRLRTLAIRSRSIATTLRPLGMEASAALLEHGYLTCMANCHLLLGFSRFDDPPTASDFARLAAGDARERHPRS